MPVYPRLLVEITGGASRAAVTVDGLAVFAAMQFVFAPILGNLSDRYGRRRVILFAVGALGVDHHHGFRADSRVALRRPRDCGCRGRFVHARLCVRRRHQSAGEARSELRGCERGLWNRLHHRTGIGGLLGTRTARPVFRGRGVEPDQLLLRFLRAAGIPASGKAARVRVAARQPTRHPQPDEEAPRRARTAGRSSCGDWGIR